MSKTKIEWADETWNPVTGCTKVSQGCKNCYAERVFPRVYGNTFVYEQHHGPEGLTNPRPFTLKRGRKFTDVRCHPERLDQPQQWRKPRMVFVNSMSDLFHEDVSNHFIGDVFWVMAEDAPQHTYQVLTKRPERMLEAVSRMYDDSGVAQPKNIWLGVSVEDQETADERIPLLLETPAAVRFVSYEPALAPVDFWWWLEEREGCANCGDGQPFGRCCEEPLRVTTPALDWIIVGGESGPKARGFDVQWARDTIAQCRAAGIACFVKQLGSFPTLDYGPSCRTHYRFKDRKGGDMSEWPEDLRVREVP